MNTNYKITTAQGIAFWKSSHKCNLMKAIIAFSKDEQDAKSQMKRRGYTLAFRNRAWCAFGKYVNQPSMTAIPFTNGSIAWWECCKCSGTDSGGGTTFRMLRWDDSTSWSDTSEWKETEEVPTT